MTFVIYLPKISVDYMLVSMELKAEEEVGGGKKLWRFRQLKIYETDFSCHY